MAKEPRAKKPGANYRLNKFKVLRLTDTETGEVIATIRWRPRGHVTAEYANYVKLKVAPDPKA